MAEKAKAQLAWLEGSYLRRRELLAKIEQRFADADRLICTGDMSVEYLLGEMETGSCFAQQKLVIIHDMPIFGPTPATRSKGIGLLKDSLLALNDKTFVVFNGQDQVRYKTIYTAIKNRGKIYEFAEKVEENEAVKWVIEHFDKLGHKIDEKTARHLVLNYGWDDSLDGYGLDGLEMTLSALSLYLGKTKEVTEDHISTATFENENVVVWQLCNAFDAHNFEEAISVMVRSANRAGSWYDAVVSLLPVLLWRYRMLLFLKECLISSPSKDSAIEKAMTMRKLKQSGMAEKMVMAVEVYKSGENKGQTATAWNYGALSVALNGFNGGKPPVEQYTRKMLFALCRIITDAILGLRQNGSEVSAALVADVLCMTACSKLDDKLLSTLIASILDD